MGINLVVDFIPSRVTKNMNQCLLRPFVVEKVRNAIFGVCPTKTSGFDGMPALFFHKYWQVVGNVLLMYASLL